MIRFFVEWINAYSNMKRPMNDFDWFGIALYVVCVGAAYSYIWKYTIGDDKAKFRFLVCLLVLGVMTSIEFQYKTSLAAGAGVFVPAAVMWSCGRMKLNDLKNDVDVDWKSNIIRILVCCLAWECAFECAQLAIDELVRLANVRQSSWNSDKSVRGYSGF